MPPSYQGDSVLPASCSPLAAPLMGASKLLGLSSLPTETCLKRQTTAPQDDSTSCVYTVMLLAASIGRMPIRQATRHRNDFTLQDCFRDPLCQLPSPARGARTLSPERGKSKYGALKRFCAFAGLSGRYISHLDNGRKNIGDAIAAALEAAFGRPANWFSTQHAAPRIATAELLSVNRVVSDALTAFKKDPGATYEALRRIIGGGGGGSGGPGPK